MEVSNLCFICFRGVSSNSNETPKSDLGGKFATNIRQYFSLDDSRPGREEMSTNEDDFSAVCSECEPSLEEFCEMHAQLQNLQKRLKAKVEKISRVMTEAEREIEGKEEFEAYQKFLQLHRKRIGQRYVDVAGFRKDFLQRVHATHHPSEPVSERSSRIQTLSCAAPADSKAVRKNEIVTSESHSLGHHPSTSETAKKSLLNLSGSTGKPPNPTRRRWSRRFRISDNQKQCVFCPQYFKYFNDLERHLISHIGEKWHCCKICGNEFSRRSNLVSHRRVHTGERLHKCKLCEKRLTTRAGLERHIRIHTHEKPYKCQFCKKEFTQRGNCKAHEKIHEKKLEN